MISNSLNYSFNIKQLIIIVLKHAVIINHITIKFAIIKIVINTNIMSTVVVIVIIRVIIVVIIFNLECNYY